MPSFASAVISCCRKQQCCARTLVVSWHCRNSNTTRAEITSVRGCSLCSRRHAWAAHFFTRRALFILSVSAVYQFNIGSLKKREGCTEVNLNLIYDLLSSSHWLASSCPIPMTLRGNRWQQEVQVFKCASTSLHNFLFTQVRTGEEKAPFSSPPSLFYLL